MHGIFSCRKYVRINCTAFVLVSAKSLGQRLVLLRGETVQDAKRPKRCHNESDMLPAA